MRAKFNFIAGLLCGALLFGGTVAYAAGVMAEKSTNQFYIDGELTEVEAYVINGNNYVKLRDIGEVVDFNVYWDGAVQVESDKPYTGEAPRVEIDYDADRAFREEIAALVNKLRRENGLPELVIDDALMDSAQERAVVCSERGNISHDKALSTEILLKHGYGNGGAACNLGWSSNRVKTADEVVTMFEKSPGHRSTMLLTGVDDIGIGVYCDGKGINVVMYISNKNAY